VTLSVEKLITLDTVREVHRRNAEFREMRVRATKALQLEQDVTAQKVKVMSTEMKSSIKLTEPTIDNYATREEEKKISEL